MYIIISTNDILRFLSWGKSCGYLFPLLGAIEKLIMMSASYDMVKRCRNAEDEVQNENIETSFMVGDEEFLPIKERYILLPQSLISLFMLNTSSCGSFKFY